MRKWIIIVLILMVVAPLIADRGGIPYRPEVQVFEPGQKAVIAFNGEEEILYLSTDLYASDDVKVVELVPFPSKPEVKEGDKEMLKRLEKFLQPFVAPRGFREDGGAKQGGGVAGGVEIIEFKKIGAHNITLLMAKEEKVFTDWIANKIGESIMRNEAFKKRLCDVVNHYIRLGFQYFAFDEVELTKDKRTVEPLEYRFRTPFPYYPLVVSSLMSGDTNITLAFIAPRAITSALLSTTLDRKDFVLHKFQSEQRRDVAVSSVFISSERLTEIWQSGATLFKEIQEGAEISVFRYSGTLKFSYDIPDIKKASERGAKLAKLLKNEADKAYEARQYRLAEGIYEDVAVFGWCAQNEAEAAQKRIQEMANDEGIKKQMPPDTVSRDVQLMWLSVLGCVVSAEVELDSEAMNKLLGTITTSTTSPTMNEKVRILKKLLKEW